MLAEPQSEQVNSNEECYIAALDLGSNSFHMVIAKQSHGELRIIETLGEKVQLASGIDQDGRITEEAMVKAVACLERFRQRIRLFESPFVQIVGTNALRVAKNSKKFIKRAQIAVGFPIDVISGYEEARLIYLGVAHSMADDGGNRLVIDIGGGSTEFVIGERFEPALLESLHMGCVSFRDRYLSEQELSSKDLKKAIFEASRELMNIKRAFKNKGWSSCVGSSGSIKAISTSLVHLGLSDGSISLSGLEELKKHMLAFDTIDQLQALGVKPDRTSTFAAGFAILYAAFTQLGIKTMTYNSGALREGLLYDMLGRNSHEDVRHRTIKSLQHRYHIDIDQCERVEATLLHAYAQVSKDWKIKTEEAKSLLVWACQIHELGATISHSQHHKHGAYLIRHSDLPGFTDRNKTMLATIIRLHRRKFSSTPLEELESDDAKLIKKLCVLFRLSIILTSSRISKETDFKLRVKDDTQLAIKMGDSWLSKHPLTNAGLVEEQLHLRKAGLTLEIE